MNTYMMLFEEFEVLKRKPKLKTKEEEEIEAVLDDKYRDLGKADGTIPQKIAKDGEHRHTQQDFFIRTPHVVNLTP